VVEVVDAVTEEDDMDEDDVADEEDDEEVVTPEELELELVDEVLVVPGTRAI